MAVEQKVTAPDGLTDAEVKAWKESLPDPVKEETSSKDAAGRLSDVEARLQKLEDLLNVKLDA